MAQDQRLMKAKDDQVLTGVLGGVAAYLDMDPTLVRILYVIIALVTGFFPALVVYVVLALIMPEEGEAGPETTAEETPSTEPGTDQDAPGT